MRLICRSCAAAVLWSLIFTSEESQLLLVDSQMIDNSQTYRVIQATVFYNLPLNDLTNQTNGITQWFLGSWYLDILIFWCLIIVSWKNLVFSGLSNNGIIGSILQGLSAQITPKHIWKPHASTNTIQIPSGNHIDTPQTSPYNTRHQQTATDTNRQQQRPTDGNRHQRTLPCVFLWVW